jgi:fructosamine-3-kinase
MKIWYHHGSEHSANLVMIGHFEDATEAEKAKEIIDALTKQVAEDQNNGTLVLGDLWLANSQVFCKHPKEFAFL